MTAKEKILRDNGLLPLHRLLAAKGGAAHEEVRTVSTTDSSRHRDRRWLGSRAT